MQLDAILQKSNPSEWTASSIYVSVKYCTISKREHSGRNCLYSREVQQPLNWHLKLQNKAPIGKYDPCSVYHVVCKISARCKVNAAPLSAGGNTAFISLGRTITKHLPSFPASLPYPFVLPIHNSILKKYFKSHTYIKRVSQELC